MPLRMPPEATPRTHCVLLAEHVDPRVVSRASVAAAVGAELFTAIASAPHDDGRRYPVLILINGWIQVAWIDLMSLTWGGVA